MFDNYTLKARFYPVIILFFPIVIMGVLYSFQFESLTHAFTSLGIVGALTYLFSQLGRDQGKNKEQKLWEIWGGTPSIQILRFRDKHLDIHTKERYHQKLQSLCPIIPRPDKNMEINDPSSADEAYGAWTKFTISQTRDSNKYHLLLKENISYGFRRNLWGLKSISIFLILALIACNYFYWQIKCQSFNPIDFPNSFKYSIIILICILIFWLFIVTKKWIKIAAFAYAERLFESLENI